MNIFGIGTDIVEIARIEDSISRFGSRFLERVFTPSEQEYCRRMGRPASHFAARFAAKEAVAKALGTGIGQHANWTDLEIQNGSSGRPVLALSGAAAEFAAAHGIVSIHISLSHAQSHATAHAIAVTAHL